MNGPERREAPTGQRPTPKPSEDSREGISQWSAKGKPVRFGPFLGVDSELIHFAGWQCPRCRKPVRKFGQPVPGLVPRMIFHACQCVTVMTWKDEATPTAKIWPKNVELARRSGADLLAFNGGRDTPAGFQGIN